MPMRLAISEGPPTCDRARSNAFISHILHDTFDGIKHAKHSPVSHLKQVRRHSSAMSKSRDRLLFAAKKLKGWHGPKEVSEGLTLAGFQVSTQTIGNWKEREVPPGAAVDAARIIGCRVEWITEGSLPMESVSLLSYTNALTKSVSLNVQQIVPRENLVPLISDEQAGMWTEDVDVYKEGYAEEWLPVVNTGHERAFAVRVTGDSMTAPQGRTYPDGTIIIVDPRMRLPKSGSRILAKLGGGAVAFRVFMEEHGQRWLKPLNHLHPPIFDDFEVIGTVFYKCEPDTD